ncbi:hypothetical protein AB0H11_27595 [Streptomyces mirabilis]|uniref:hypothetical protein n=1 Tax=unclassified Streptomyces TaxID=2593676 RepID=UPI001CEC67CF|nr:MULTISPECIES: hypothetical protein [unclassified Streptomyces]
MGVREDDVNPSTRLVGHFVCRVLDELKELAIAVSALGDPALTIGVLGHETGVHRVSLQDA